MYDELVERLRKYAKEHCPLDRASGICGCIDAREAADAIEELSKRIDRAVERYNRDVERSAMYEALVGIAPQPSKEKEKQ